MTQRGRPRFSQGDASQGARSQGESDEDISALAYKAVHFMLAHAGAYDAPVKHLDLKKAIFPNSRIKEPLQIAEKVLNDTFGYELHSIDKKSTKVHYYLTNALGNEGHLQLAKNTRGYRTLLSIVLTYIFMNRGPVEQKNLIKFLSQAGVGIERRSSFFGNVAELIYKTPKQDPIFVRDQFLAVTETEQGIYFDWGPRAKKEVDKRAVLKFASEILDTDIAQWPMHLKDIDNEEMET